MKSRKETNVSLTNYELFCFRNLRNRSFRTKSSVRNEVGCLGKKRRKGTDGGSR